MKKAFIACMVVIFSFLSVPSLHSGFFDDFISDSTPDAYICADGECGLDAGIELAKQGINDIEKERTLSEYVQDIVIYLLTFISIVSVIYIIYAGFNILIWNGDEEKLKKSKMTIIYVAIGVVLIWLAWPITAFFLNVLNIS